MLVFLKISLKIEIYKMKLIQLLKVGGIRSGIIFSLQYHLLIKNILLVGSIKEQSIQSKIKEVVVVVMLFQQYKQ